MKEYEPAYWVLRNPFGDSPQSPLVLLKGEGPTISSWVPHLEEWVESPWYFDEIYGDEPGRVEVTEQQAAQHQADGVGLSEERFNQLLAIHSPSRSTPHVARYGGRYERALVRAAQLHSNQFRKRGADEDDVPPIPYLAHLLEVSALVWLAGGNEDTAIAGLLHDTLEDQGHQITADQIETEFGTEVRELVEACSDGEPNQRRDASTWKSRKQAYLDHLRVATDDALLVTAADKVSNAQAIVTDVERHGAIVWKRFNASPGGHLLVLPTGTCRPRRSTPRLCPDLPTRAPILTARRAG